MSSSLPAHWRVERAKLADVIPLDDPAAAIAATLAHPLASLPLGDLCAEGSRVTIVTDDSAPFALVIPPLLNELKAAGVRDEDITVLSARSADILTGQIAGSGLTSIKTHDPSNESELDELGAVDGIHITLNRHAAEADLLIAACAIRPHPYAGYAGAEACVALGCAGETTRRDLLGLPFLDDPRVRAGRVQDNPFARMMREIARRAGLLFCLSVVMRGDDLVAARAGSPGVVFDDLLETARETHEATTQRGKYGVVLVEGPSVGENTLFEVSAIAAEIAAANKPVLAAGGSLILPVTPDPPAPNPRRENFYAALADTEDMQSVAQRLRYRGAQMGQHRAYRLAQAMSQNDLSVIVVGANNPALIKNCGFIPAETMQDAAKAAENLQFSDTIHCLIAPAQTQVFNPAVTAYFADEDEPGLELPWRQIGKSGEFNPFYK